MRKVSNLLCLLFFVLGLSFSKTQANDRDKELKKHLEQSIKAVNERFKQNQQLLLLKKNAQLDVVIDRYIQVATNANHLPIDSYLSTESKRKINGILGRLRQLDLGYGNAYMYVLVTSGPPIHPKSWIKERNQKRKVHEKASAEYLKKIQAAIAQQVKSESEKFAQSVFYNSALGKATDNGILLNLYIQKVEYEGKDGKTYKRYKHAYNVVGAQGKVAEVIKNELNSIVFGATFNVILKSARSRANKKHYGRLATTNQMLRNHLLRCATYTIAEKFFAEFGYKVPKLRYEDIKGFESFFVDELPATSLLKYSKRDLLVAERIYWKFRQFSLLFGQKNNAYISGYKFVQNAQFKLTEILSLDGKTPIQPDKIFTAEELDFINQHTNKDKQRENKFLHEVFPMLYAINMHQWHITGNDTKANPRPTANARSHLANLFFSLRNNITGLQLDANGLPTKFGGKLLADDALYELMQVRFGLYQQIVGEGVLAFGKNIVQVLNVKKAIDSFVSLLTSAEIPPHWWNKACVVVPKSKKKRQCNECDALYKLNSLPLEQQLNLAFIAGIYNGLIDQVKGSAQLASLVVGYVSDRKFRNKLNEAIANLKKSQIYAEIKKYTDQYTSCGPHVRAHRSGKDLINALAMFVGIGELRAAAKSDNFLKTLTDLGVQNAKNMGKMVGKVANFVVFLKNAGLKVVYKGKQILVYVGTKGDELLLTIENNLVILAKQLDNQVTGGKLLGSFDQLELSFANNRINTKVSLWQKEGRVYMKQASKGGGNALDWVGLLSNDALKAIKNWDDDLKLALHADLRASDDLVETLKDVRLLEGWKVLSSDANLRINTKHLQDISKYLETNLDKLDKVKLGFEMASNKRKYLSNLKNGKHKIILKELLNQPNIINIGRERKQIGDEYYKITDIKIEDGLIKDAQGIALNTKKHDFVITLDGELRIGRGHDYLSGNAEAVKGAGTIRIRDGKVIDITNNTGHFAVTEAELLQQVKILDEMKVTHLERNIRVKVPDTKNLRLFNKQFFHNKAFSKYFDKIPDQLKVLGKEKLSRDVFKTKKELLKEDLFGDETFIKALNKDNELITSWYLLSYDPTLRKDLVLLKQVRDYINDVSGINYRTLKKIIDQSKTRKIFVKSLKKVDLPIWKHELVGGKSKFIKLDDDLINKLPESKGVSFVVVKKQNGTNELRLSGESPTTLFHLGEDVSGFGEILLKKTDQGYHIKSYFPARSSSFPEELTAEICCRQLNSFGFDIEGIFMYTGAKSFAKAKRFLYMYAKKAWKGERIPKAELNVPFINELRFLRDEANISANPRFFQYEKPIWGTKEGIETVLNAGQKRLQVSINNFNRLESHDIALGLTLKGELNDFAKSNHATMFWDFDKLGFSNPNAAGVKKGFDVLQAIIRSRKQGGTIHFRLKNIINVRQAIQGNPNIIKNGQPMTLWELSNIVRNRDWLEHTKFYHKGKVYDIINHTKELEDIGIKFINETYKK